ncbi:MAG: cache domain-containing protein [Gammaproteobacteria bacterium]
MGTLTQCLSELKAFVHSGVAYAEKNGLEKTLQEITKCRNGVLRKGEPYLYAYDYKGTCLAHGNFPDILIGRNFFEYKDQYGIEIIQLLIKIAKDGGGFATYYWTNPDEPNTKKQGDFKLVYVEPIPGADIFIACDSWE